jgi:hypothetical protein
MQKRVTIVLFVFIVATLGLILSSLLSGEDSSVHVDKKYLSPLETKSEERIRSRTWSEALAKSNEIIFSFPINELYIKIDLKEYTPPKTKTYRLVVDRADQYSLFCVVQTLSKMRMPHVVEKKDKTLSVYVGSETKQPLKNVVEKLKEYNIESKIMEIWL